jgi:hypothetical protein
MNERKEGEMREKKWGRKEEEMKEKKGRCEK